MSTPIIHTGTTHRSLLLLNMVIAIIYFSWWFFPAHVGNRYLYGLLFFGELYHVIMAFTFWHTIWPHKKSSTASMNLAYSPTIDIFITVVNEPVDIVRKTALAAKNITYKNHKVYILNDGFVAKNNNWLAYEKLAEELHIHCITRKIGGGAKAGNINNALKHTSGEFVAIFDADMEPHKDFIEQTIHLFQDSNVGFVQSPQYYKNYRRNIITGSAWEQQEFFFGPIMEGKDQHNSSFICGTNFVVRRQALEEVGGMCEDNIAEDFLTSLFIHQKKWTSIYVPNVLAEGLAPEDLLSYYKQQLRWARGSLEILFKHNPFFKRGLTWGQRVQYLSSALYYFNGVIVVIDMIIPLVFLFTGIQAVTTSTTSFAIFFIPFILSSLYTLYRISEGSLSFRAISFSQSIWTLQLTALFSVILGKKTAFNVTPKKAQQGNFISLAYPHIIYAILVIAASIVGIYREGFNPAVLTNVAWGAFNVSMFLPFIAASYRWSSLFGSPEISQIPELDSKKNISV